MGIITKPTIRNSVQNQLLAGLIVNIPSILYGMAGGWPSYSMLLLESPSDSPMDKGALDLEERSWVTSLFAIAGVAGTVFFYPFCDILGRKWSLCLLAIPHATSWVLIEFGVQPWHLYLSRVLSGLSSGGGFCLVPVFVSEICESHVRGRLGSLMMLTSNVGFLLSFIAGFYLSYHQIPYIGFGLSVAYLAIFLFFPETPQFLLKRKKEELAEKSFRFYRNLSSDAEFTDKRKKEWELLKIINLKSSKPAGDTTQKASWTDLFKTRHGRKALVIGVALITMHELCGFFTMLNYTALIFRESGSTISPNFSAIIVGVIQLLGTYVATFFVDQFGRKKLLIASSVGSALCLTCLGAYSYSHSIGIDVSAFSWISIASFSGMMFLAAIGLIPLMPVVISEVMPEQIRDIGCTICFCSSWVLAFLMVKFFESGAEIVGMHGWVFFFAISTLLGTLFTIFGIPETKGKTYAEIATLMER